MRNATAYQQWLGHPRWTHTIGPGRFMFAFCLVATRSASIRNNSFSTKQLVNMMLATTLEVLKCLIKFAFEILRGLSQAPFKQNDQSGINNQRGINHLIAKARKPHIGRRQQTAHSGDQRPCLRLGSMSGHTSPGWTSRGQCKLAAVFIVRLLDVTVNVPARMID